MLLAQEQKLLFESQTCLILTLITTTKIPKKINITRCLYVHSIKKKKLSQLSVLELHEQGREKIQSRLKRHHGTCLSQSKKKLVCVSAVIYGVIHQDKLDYLCKLPLFKHYYCIILFGYGKRRLIYSKFFG